MLHASLLVVLAVGGESRGRCSSRRPAVQKHLCRGQEQKVGIGFSAVRFVEGRGDVHLLARLIGILVSLGEHGKVGNLHFRIRCVVLFAVFYYRILRVDDCYNGMFSAFPRTFQGTVTAVVPCGFKVLTGLVSMRLSPS